MGFMNIVCLVSHGIPGLGADQVIEVRRRSSGNLEVGAHREGFLKEVMSKLSPED